MRREWLVDYRYNSTVTESDHRDPTLIRWYPVFSTGLDFTEEEVGGANI